MSENDGASPRPEQRPPGRFRQSHLDSTDPVDNWLKGNGRIVFGIILIVMALGFVYFAFFA